ncbi:hypothetical protein [Cupriavidus necator]
MQDIAVMTPDGFVQIVGERGGNLRQSAGAHCLAGISQRTSLLDRNARQTSPFRAGTDSADAEGVLCQG